MTEEYKPLTKDAYTGAYGGISDFCVRSAVEGLLHTFWTYSLNTFNKCTRCDEIKYYVRLDDGVCQYCVVKEWFPVFFDDDKEVSR